MIGAEYAVKTDFLHTWNIINENQNEINQSR